MKHPKQIFTVCLLAIFSFAIGCSDSDTKPKPKTADNTEAAHAHAPGDELVWEVKEKIADTDIEIWLGHHGTHFHGGDIIEPSVAIMKAGEAVADAKVLNQLVDPNDQSKLLTEEVPTVYEPESADEIAHYAQGDLKIPADATKCIIRFRIEIPAMDSISRDVTVEVGH